MKFKHWILAPGNINETSYPGNIGFEEMVKFYKMAKSNQIKEMESAIKSEDWDGFKNLIRKVIGVMLK